MRRRIVLTASALFIAFSESAVVSRAQELHEALGGATAATVGPVNTTIAALNYAETGTTVDGLLVGTNVLLTFSKPVCGGIASLGNPTDKITYSGVALTFASGFQTVHVTSFTNNTNTSITYPPPAPPKPAAYPATPGMITSLNYSEFGTINGFMFTPTSGPKVFVNIATPGSTLAPLLTVGAAVSVTGTLEPPLQCSATGALSEVDASSLTIGSTTYPISGMGKGFGFGGFR